MNSSFLSVPLFAAALMIAVAPAAAPAADPDAIGDGIERRLDRRGDVIDRRLDNRGDRVERRFDRRADRADAAGREHLAECLSHNNPPPLTARLDGGGCRRWRRRADSANELVRGTRAGQTAGAGYVPGKRGASRLSIGAIRDA